MNATELAAKIDHTVLGPETTPDDVSRVMDEATEYGMNACVPPCYVAEASSQAPEVTIATVVGFPHGQHSPAAKAAEANEVVGLGADEIDMVQNVGRLKDGDEEAVRADIGAVTDSVDVPVKVILETALLDESEIRRACQCAVDVGADYVKTSTGFADGGARVEDVRVMAEYLPVKASGGIGSWADAEAMLEAGASRIGASSGVAIVEDFTAKQ